MSHKPTTTDDTQPLGRLAIPLRLADGSTALVREINRKGLYLEAPGPRTLQGPLLLELQPAGSRVKVKVQCEVVNTVHMGATSGISLRFLSTSLHALD